MDAGVSCNGSCATGYFCEGCTTGICKPLADTSAPIGPVCGCDGVTYWNAALANEKGESVEHEVQCPQSAPKTVKCASGSCASDQYCNRATTVSAGLCAPSGLDTCWVLPDTCPSKPQGKPCGVSLACQAQCDLIKAQKAWHPMAASSCP